MINSLIGAYNGHNDVELSDLGVRQMEGVGERLRHEPVNVVYCSDLIRSRKGAEIIGRDHNLVPIVDINFREMNFGLWEGLTFTEISEQFPDELKLWNKASINYAPPEGENVSDLRERVVPALRQIVTRHHGQAITLVAHGGVNRVILADAMNLSLKDIYSMEQDYGCINIIDYFQDLAVVKLMNGGINKDRQSWA
ncbi:MAG: histidine phosphatase family protein [Deltaproteobacteria bacterium]|nr:histidine phosphatase family protein [Deltaproteobacteria bacterium]